MTTEPRTLGGALLESRDRLHRHSDSPRIDAEWLWSHVLGRPRSWLLAHPEQPLSVAEQARGEYLVTRRQQGHSVAHLCGGCEFLDFELRLNARVLAPRPETELLVDAALQGLPRQARILEWGTGSGALALAIARARPDCRVLGLDLSRAAVSQARDNARRLRLRHARFALGDWRRAWPDGVFELILGNPPYVAAQDTQLNTPGVRREPRHALVAAAQGSQALRVLAARAARHAHRRTRLLLEHGAEQGDVCRRIVARAGFGDCRTLFDLAGRPRACLSSPAAVRATAR